MFIIFLKKNKLKQFYQFLLHLPHICKKYLYILKTNTHEDKSKKT
mgnify:CR=1 FL=1|jgi:hypothetical protein